MSPRDGVLDMYVRALDFAPISAIIKLQRLDEFKVELSKLFDPAEVLDLEQWSLDEVSS